MTRPYKIEGGEPVDTVDAGIAVIGQSLVGHTATGKEARRKTDQPLALMTQIMNAMEQGILVWSEDGICRLHNTRIFDILELRPDGLAVGMKRDDFLAEANARGEFDAAAMAETHRKFVAGVPFQFDRLMPSGRVVATYARPIREGGFVVTFTDVSAVRNNARSLDEARTVAEAAEAKAKQVLQDERARRAEARALSDLDEWMQSCKSLNELFMIVQKFMEGLIPDSRGELYLYSNSRDVLDGVCEWGQQGEINDHIKADECWSLRRGRAYLHNPEALCFPCEHLSDEHVENPANYICVPVVAHGDTVGLLHVHFSPHSPHAEVRAMGKFANRCGEHISMAIANVKLRDELHHQSIRDPLTGLYNRRYFMDAMRRETLAADRGGKGFGLISLDADKFKLFNDNHGHEAGDTVLRALSEQMLASLPEDAICARVGGEEFAVVLPQTDLKTSEALANTLREAVGALEVRSAFEALPKITISAGVAAYLGDGMAPNVLMKIADEALYAAKAAGRNCVIAATLPKGQTQKSPSP